ncbi:MAG: hypothetical protein HYR85_27770 [Planctomycetes bacterium]|nr:hypothetical protein [Planctomycetota bacterium]MBI3844220.1 hypothetical protein [Planctomycetota bacterium]
MESKVVRGRPYAAFLIGNLLLVSAGCSSTRLEVSRDGETTSWTSMQERSFRENAAFAWKQLSPSADSISFREWIAPVEPFEFTSGGSLVLCLRWSGAILPDGSPQVRRGVLVVSLPMANAADGATFDAGLLQAGFYEEDGQPGGLVLAATAATGSLRLDVRMADAIQGSLDLAFEAASASVGTAAKRYPVRIRGDFAANRRRS